jgi:hypothetical protein
LVKEPRGNNPFQRLEVDYYTGLKVLLKTWFGGEPSGFKRTKNCVIIWIVLNWSARCSRVLFENMIVAQLAKTFPAFYGTRMWITMFARARHWALYRYSSLPPHFFNSHFNIILLSTPKSPKWLHSFRFLTQVSLRATCPAYLIYFDAITLMTFYKSLQIKLPSLCIFSIFLLLLSFASKYLSPCFVFGHNKNTEVRRCSTAQNIHFYLDLFQPLVSFCVKEASNAGTRFVTFPYFINVLYINI